MYIPKHFEETRKALLFQLMEEFPLGTLVTLDAESLNANHLPFEIDPLSGPFGTLRGHVARANPVWQSFSPDVDALVVFQGASSYISPSWYPSKEDHGKVVPTYNYMVVHAAGPLKVIDDPVWLLDLVERLTNRHESNIGSSWKVSDAPKEYIDKMLAAIVGIEIPLSKLIGKWKTSQNQPAANRAGVVRGLLATGEESAVAMAVAVKEGGKTTS